MLFKSGGPICASKEYIPLAWMVDLLLLLPASTLAKDYFEQRRNFTWPPQSTTAMLAPFALISIPITRWCIRHWPPGL
jgi:hypothetical protein